MHERHHYMRIWLRLLATVATVGLITATGHAQPAESGPPLAEPADLQAGTNVGTGQPAGQATAEKNELRTLLVEILAEGGITTAGLENGRFFMTSSDGNYRLTIGGRVQARYEYRNHPDREDTSSYYLRRVRLDLRGHFVDPRLTYRIMPELARTANLRDGWINYQIDRTFEVRAGQFTVPFQWHRYISGNRQHFLERGVPSNAFGVPGGYDIGIGFHGRNTADTFSYGVGLFDGAGRNVRESNSNGHMASSRLTWAALGILPREEPDLAYTDQLQLTFGAGQQGANKNEVRAWDLGRSAVDNQRADWATATADVSLRYRGFSLIADGYIRRVIPDDPTVEAYTGWAYMISGGYFLHPRKIELIGRFSQLMLDRQDRDTREREWGTGLNIYHHGHSWKTQINYSNHQQETGTEHVFALQNHLAF